MESHRQLEDQAAAFLARRDGGDWTDEHQAQLDEWLAESTARRVAFLRLEAVWDEARRLKALSAGRPPGTVPPPGEWRDTPFFDSNTRPPLRAAFSSPEPAASRPDSRGSRMRLQVRHVALAAAILLALGIGVYFTARPSGDSYSTPIGGVASVPLRDGSSVTLNTASTVRVELTPQERRVDLARGEAFFVVAKDRNRPFVVRAGNKRVVAVGTQFSVRLDGDDVRVIVTEGTVRLESIGRPMHVTGEGVQAEGGSATPESARLAAGTIARAADGDVLVQETSIPEAEQALTWRLGYLTFHEATLAEAVEEFNRYNEHRITIKDPNLAAIRISGTFRPTNYEAFVRLLQEGYGIRSERTDGEITLTTQ